MPATSEDSSCSAAAYPPDMWQRLSRLPGMSITKGAAEELPADLPWQDGSAEPPLGDVHAQKGGSLRLSSPGPFPSNLLAFGSPYPQFFHTNAFDCVELPLVQQHPITHACIGGVARAWAVIGRTVYFRLHPGARYSNGRPVRAADYALGALLRAQAGRDGAWATLVREAESVCIYGEDTLAITMRRERPLPELRAAALLHAAEPGFYAEFGSDYAEVYAWRVPPTTGAYAIGRIERGRLIELRRVRHWWAEDLPQRRFTCNADSICYYFLQDEAQVWELFMRGRLDVLQTRHVAAWQRHESAESRLLFRTYKVDAPMPPYGIALNASRLDDISLRRGLMSAMDMRRAVDTLFRGQAEQLPSFFSGYGALSPRSTPRHVYDPAAARAFFAQAGYIEPGADGILHRPDGARLSVPLAYVPSEKVSALVALLQESAARCGAEIVPEPLSWQQVAHLVREGRHAMVFWAAVPHSLLPDPARHFASWESGDEAPFCLKDARMDALLCAYEKAAVLHDLADVLAQIDALVQHLAIWAPAWQENRVYLAHRPHVHFPELPGSRYDAVDNHTFWCTERRDP